MAVRKKTASAGNPRVLGLALSGGGARGAFQVGVFERLVEDARFAGVPAILSGTSAGAINAALIAAGKTPSQLRELWRDLARRVPVSADRGATRELGRTLFALLRGEGLGLGRTVVDFAYKAARLGSAGASFVELLLLDRFDLSTQFLQQARVTALFDTRALRQRLVDALGGEEVRPLPGVDLAIQVVDANAGTSVRYVTRATRHTSKASGYEVVPAITVDMVMASASIPLLFPATDVRGRKLWDGGVLVNTPLAPLVDLGATEIVTVLVTEDPKTRRAPFDNLGDALERVTDTLLDNTYNVDRKLLLERNRVASKDPRRYRAVSLYEPIRPGGADNVFTIGSYLDFHTRAIEAMTDAGRAAADAWLKRGPQLDRL